ncbi:Na+/H+ antiporter [Devosia sp. 2618]|uniref:Na+/H+ antiporter n=1 Tax=Devosia sp. 2618 TaxID=3156454 RepID=UPI003390A37C
MHPVQIFELIFALLAAILLLHWAAERLRLPPAVALLVGGGALAFIPGLPIFELDPELALVLFLPPLLMASAYSTALTLFRRHIIGILSLAIGAVIFTTLVVGLVLHLLVPALPWAACFALGAIVSPPDAVSARAVLQRVHLPRRLTTLLEGESLINDATGLVLFRFAVVATLTSAFDAWQASFSFAILSFGGIAVGCAIGALCLLLIHKLRDSTLIVITTTMMCWAAYLAGEAVQVSGVISTVTFGLVYSWFQHGVISAQVRNRELELWTLIIFVFEAMVFVLIGFSLRGVLDRVGGIDVVVATMTVPVLGVVAAVIVARFAWVYGSNLIIALLKKIGLSKEEPLEPRAAGVLSWAGMRGVVTLAVALTLPQHMPGRDLMLVIAFAVILVTVLVQGTSLGFIIKLAKLEDRDPPPRLNRLGAERAIAQAQFAAVEANAYGPDGTLIHPMLLERYSRRAKQGGEQQERTQDMADGINAHFDLVVTAIAAGRAELIRLHRAGDISNESLHSLERDLDLQELTAASARII